MKYKALDYVLISSFKKKNLQLLCDQLCVDFLKLRLFVHKIIYIKLLDRKLDLFLELIYYTNLNHISIELKMYYMFTNLYLVNSSRFFYNYYFNNYIYYINTNTNSIYRLYLLYYMYFFIFILLFFGCFFCVNKSNSYASLPNKIKKFTVLRSPHIDKKSREQFELRIRKRIYSFDSMFSNFYSHLCESHYWFYLCNYLQCHTYTKSDEL